MRSMLVHKGLRRIPKEQFGNDKQPDIFFAIQSLLENMATITVRGKLYNAPSNYMMRHRHA